MSRKAMAAIGLVVVLVLGAFGFLVGGPLLAVGGLVVGALLVVVVLRRTADRETAVVDEAPVKEKRTRRSSSSSTVAPPAESLLPTWTPPAEAEPEPAPTSSWDENWSPGDGWAEGGVDTAEANPLDELESLDDVDVIAEVERIESRDAETAVDDLVVEEVDLEVVEVEEAPDLDADGFPVKEDVETADDIMAASQATELTVDGGDNTELAKLLAKVQARLAAYE